jgi:hypothetical protein
MLWCQQQVFIVSCIVVGPTAKHCWNMKVEACYYYQHKNELQVSSFYFYLALCFVICFDFKGLGEHTTITNDEGNVIIVLIHFDFKALRW